MILSDEHVLEDRFILLFDFLKTYCFDKSMSYNKNISRSSANCSNFITESKLVSSDSRLFFYLIFSFEIIFLLLTSATFPFTSDQGLRFLLVQIVWQLFEFQMVQQIELSAKLLKHALPGVTCFLTYTNDFQYGKYVFHHVCTLYTFWLNM